MLAGMFSSRQTLRQDEKGYIFIDRDGEHFRHIQRSGIDTRITSIIFKGVNLCGLNLSKLDLSVVDFSNVCLRNVCFSGANLQRASFNHMDAEGAAFDNADLLESTFVGANLRGASFLGATSKNYNLTGASCVEDCKGVGLCICCWWVEFGLRIISRLCFAEQNTFTSVFL
ncbi:hypothetical protein PS1_029328 [Malus domestica]